MTVSEDAILIVEPDDGLLASFAAHFETKQDFKFYAVKTAAETRDAVLKYRPRLILMEMQLPDQPGLTLFKDLQSMPRTAHIPVIFLGGGAEIFLQKQALEAGAYDFIAKPVDVAELSLRIRNALQHTHAALHPETRLPSGRMIETAIENARRDPQQVVLTLTIQNYAVFKDLYGFVVASELVIYLGNVLSEASTPEDFVGHRREVEFIIITSAQRSESLRQTLEKRIAEQLPQFHNFMEREQGYMEMSDEAGNNTQVPLMQVQILPHA